MTRIKGFDGLRALAITAVFLQHFTGLGDAYATGGYGVWLFFVLSGFLIVRILHAERARVEAGQTTVGAALKRFFWRRSLRIFPVYYLVLVVFGVLALIGWASDFAWPGPAWYASYLSNVYFIQVSHWVGRFGYFWSLAVEEQFYLLAAPLLLFSPSGWARGACAALVLAALACDLNLRTGGASEIALYVNPLTNFGALAFGGWIGLALPAKAREGVNSWPALACLALLLAWIAVFSRLGLYRPAVATLMAMSPFWVATLVGAGLVASVFLNQASWAVRALEWRPLAWLGRISYGFYLYHVLVPHWLLTGLARRAGIGWRPEEWFEAVVAFGLSVGLAALSWRLIERPLLRLKDRPPASGEAARRALSPAP